MKKKSHSIFAVLALALVIAAAIVVFALIRKYTPSKEHEDLTTYYHLTNSDEVAIVLNNEVTSSKARVIDGHIYIDYDFVHDNLNSRFYWDNNENILLYATTQNLISAQAEQTSYMVTKSSADYGRKIVTINSDTAYIDLDFVKEYSDFKYKHVKDPHRIIITSQWGKYQTATAKRNASLRVRGGIKSPILKEVSSKEEVTVIEQGDNWDKVMTDDGIIGYMQKRMLSSVKEKTRKSDFTPDTFAHIKKDYNICMAWHQVTNQSANNAVSSVLANTRGINVLSPTWFYLNDNNGGIMSLCSQDYVNYCHQQGIEVWGLVSNLENQDVDDTSVFSLTSSRDNLVNNLVAEAIKYDLDGINLDFELLPAEAADGYLEFIRELSIKCENNDLVLSVDNYVPAAYNAYYDREEQAVFADYIVVMAYDEHYNGSEEGSVASIGFVEQGIKDTLEEVPAEQVILGVPFYTRVWELTPVAEGTDAEISEEDALRGYSISSEAVSMSEVDSRVAANGVNLEWLEDCGQYYAEYQYDGKTYKIWVEDQKSIGEKLNVMKENHLAGASFWKLGYEKNTIWDTIAEAMQQ